MSDYALLALGAILTLLTLVIVVRQLATMKQQLGIMERQDELMDRRANPMVTFNRPEAEAVAYSTLEFSVENTGNKTLEDFYWQLFIPIALAQQLFRPRDGLGMQSSSLNFENVNVNHFSGIFPGPIYPTRKHLLGHIPTNSTIIPGASFIVSWKIACEDGAFPSKPDKAGHIEVIFP